jgi:hypothetical protein
MLEARVGVEEPPGAENTEVADSALCSMSTNRRFAGFSVQNRVQGHVARSRMFSAMVFCISGEGRPEAPALSTEEPKFARFGEFEDLRIIVPLARVAVAIFVWTFHDHWRLLDHGQYDITSFTGTRG